MHRPLVHYESNQSRTRAPTHILDAFFVLSFLFLPSLVVISYCLSIISMFLSNFDATVSIDFVVAGDGRMLLDLSPSIPVAEFYGTLNTILFSFRALFFCAIFSSSFSFFHAFFIILLFSSHFDSHSYLSDKINPIFSFFEHSSNVSMLSFF